MANNVNITTFQYITKGKVPDLFSNTNPFFSSIIPNQFPSHNYLHKIAAVYKWKSSFYALHLRYTTVMMNKAWIRKIIHSDYLDVIGALLILGICVYKNFHGTVYQGGEIRFGVPIADLWTQVKAGAFPLGILSTVGAIFSMLSTRFISKQKNSGNMIGVVTSVNSGAIDFLFGNRSAIITYPISFFLNSLSVFKWHQGAKIRPKDLQYYLIFVFGILLGFVLVYLGAHLFGGKTDHSFLIVVSITFGLSVGGNFANAFKYEETWLNWIMYNIVQLIKNTMLVNIANIVKYVFYLFNAVLTLLDWKWNGDVQTTTA